MKVFTEEQAAAIARALGAGRAIYGNGLFTDADVALVIDWCTDALIRSTLVNKILDGTCIVDVDENGELRFAHLDGKVLAQTEMNNGDKRDDPS
jgi:hypothetical protein